MAYIERVMHVGNHMMQVIDSVFAAAQLSDVFVYGIASLHEYAGNNLFIADCRCAERVGDNVVYILYKYYGTINVVEVCDKCSVASRAEYYMALRISEGCVVCIRSRRVCRRLLLGHRDVVRYVIFFGHCRGCGADFMRK